MLPNWQNYFFQGTGWITDCPKVAYALYDPATFHTLLSLENKCPLGWSSSVANLHLLPTLSLPVLWFKLAVEA